ncbi:MAG: MBL fold metallo-hydrolase, partial [Gemmatimonadaceae bacterium]
MTLHTYNVGFGDCFLLCWHYSGGRDRTVLIDFGTTGLPAKAPKDQMQLIAKDIAAVCQGKLDAVVVTHRHRDHVSGFATNAAGTAPGDVIRGLKPTIVVQPWTEDPKAKRKATAATETLSKSLALVRSLQEQRMVSGYVAAEAGAMLEAIGSGPGRGKFLTAMVEGMEGILNPSAVENLQTMASRHAYVNHGSKSGLESLLPGVRITVLGPPTRDQSPDIESERANDEAEFWMLQARAGRRAMATGSDESRTPLFPQARTADPTQSYSTRWLIPRLRAIRGDELLGIVRALDRQMNNTSVILLFEIRKQKLLFPGDAQIENWEFTLGKPALMSRLKDVTFYKVGHHGSRNATPKSLWKNFALKSAMPSVTRLQTVVSTKAG